MPEAQKQVVKVDKYNGITTVWMNRTEKKNALNPALHEAMDRTLAEIETDPDTKVVVIRGAGGNFSAGQDLKELFRDNEDNPAAFKRAAEHANRWRWERLYGFDKPTIAMVEGYCVGGAFMQLLATDFAVCAEDATFSLSEVNWGILPGALVSKVMADACLPRHALYYCCLEADGEESGGAARHQAGGPPRAYDGFRAGLRLPQGEGPGHQGPRPGAVLQDRAVAVHRPEELQAGLFAFQARHHAD